MRFRGKSPVAPRHQCEISGRATQLFFAKFFNLGKICGFEGGDWEGSGSAGTPSSGLKATFSPWNGEKGGKGEGEKGEEKEEARVGAGGSTCYSPSVASQTMISVPPDGLFAAAMSCRLSAENCT